MTKRKLGLLCIIAFMLATLADVQQVSAHYTLGDQLPASIGESNAGGLPINPSSGAGNGRNQFHIPPDWQGHVPGHTAFIQPGSLYIPPSDQMNYYSPNGAVITETVGDLFFYICISDDLGDGQSGPINISWRRETTAVDKSPDAAELTKRLYIAIPPEFTPPVNWTEGGGDELTINNGRGDSSNVETTITNDHNFIQTGRFRPRHPVAPDWWFVRITATPVDFPQSQVQFLMNLNPNFDSKYTTDPVYKGSSGFLYPPNMDPWLDRQMRTGDFAGCYRIKVLSMKAPSCAGKYFFKVFYTSTLQPYASIGITQSAPGSSIYGTIGGWPSAWQVPNSPYGSTYHLDPWAGYFNNHFEKYDTFWPENYPVILVKGEIDPGYISGTVRYCGHSQYYYGSYYGSGVHTSGKVIAEGTAIDPITNQPIGRQVCAVGWFLGQLPGQDESWKDRQTGSEGFYEVEGLAPGIYTLTAYAAGFVPRTLATQITVKRGQSVHGVDIYVCPTAKLQTKVYSKCPTGPVDWPAYVTLDAFPASLTILPAVSGGASVRGTSASGGQGVPVGPDGVWYWATEGATTVQAKNIWADLNSINAAGWNPTPAGLSAAMNTYDTDADMAGIQNKYGWAWQELVDSNGSAVAWQDYTFDISSAGDKRTFGTFWGDPSCYSGVETMWDGHVPTFLADFTSGVTPGIYRVKTWVFGYVQTKEYTVEFPAVEFPGTAYMEMDLFKGGIINATVHFHLQELPSAEMTDAQLSSVPNLGFLLFEAYDANNLLQAWNSTDDWGWRNNRDQSQGQSLTLIGEPNAWCVDGRVHGMPDGTYTIKAYLLNFVQQEFPQHTVQYCTNGSLSFHIVRGALINMTIYSRDCQDPSQPVNWVHPGYQISAVSVAKEVPPGYEDTLRIYPYYTDVGTFQDGTTDFVRMNSVGGTGGSLSDYVRYYATPWTRPKGAPSGVYLVYVYTPGYIQLQIPEVFAMKGSSVGDIPVYLVGGPEIRVAVDFKNELMPASLPKDFYSYYFRIEAFDEDGRTSAGNITAVPQASFATYSQYPWPGTLNPAQPGGVQSWVFQLFGYSAFTTPTNTPNWIGPGGYTLAPFYPPAGNDFAQYSIYRSGRASWDFSQKGLMWGRTYTIVVTEENQIGYIQLATVTATPTCGGITTVVFEMDRMARISGMSYVRNFMGDFRAGSWQDVTAQGATSTTKAWGPIDGFYYTYVKPDTYTVGASGPGVKSGSRKVVATWGGVAGGQDFYLEESGVPIPEFPAAGLLVLVSALAASLYLLRWRRHIAIPVR